MQNPVVYSLLWSAAIVAIFAPLAVRQYRLSTSKSGDGFRGSLRSHLNQRRYAISSSSP